MEKKKITPDAAGKQSVKPEEKKQFGEFVEFDIFPAFNIARVGNSSEEDYIVNSEVPGLWVGGVENFKGFRDDKGNLKRQAARFRLFGYDADGNVKEITSNDNDYTFDIEWKVTLANTKISNKSFQGKYKAHHALNLRNAGDRETLVDKPNTKKVTSPKQQEEIRTCFYDKSVEVSLGFIKMEESGSLVVIPSDGRAGKVKKDELIFDFVNNDFWYDTVADGSVEAVVTVRKKGAGKKFAKPLGCRQGKAWVVTAPPKYAPATHTPTSLYQTFAETQKLDKFTPEYVEATKLEYYRDIEPILHKATTLAWVNPMAWEGHGPGKSGDFTKEAYAKKLSDPEADPTFRRNVFQRIRVPESLATPFEANGQAYPYYMPILSGEGNDAAIAEPTTWYSLSPVQFLMLKKWAKTPGGFDNKVKYKTYEEIEEENRPAALNEAALEWSIGGPFHPGIEVSYPSYDPSRFKSKDFPFRVSEDTKPGDWTKDMACPWQADFYECSVNWWPATRPDQVLVNYGDYKVAHDQNGGNKAVRDGVLQPQQYSKLFKQWDRGLRGNGLNTDHDVHWGNIDMVTKWTKLGFVLPVGQDGKTIHGPTTPTSVFCEKLRTLEDGTNPKATDCTKTDLNILLQYALLIELTTIPAYLYAMYSIKDNTEFGVLARRIIRSVAIEEMLHASLVANIMTSLDFVPTFYHRSMLPYYPNPLPQFEHGTLMLAKADTKTLATFIKIEQPKPDKDTPQKPEPTPGKSVLVRLEAVEKIVADLIEKSKPQPAQVLRMASVLSAAPFRGIQQMQQSAATPTRPPAHKFEDTVAMMDEEKLQGSVASKFNFLSIADLYDTIIEVMKNLDKKNKKNPDKLQWNLHPKKQVDPGMGFAPKMANYSDENKGLQHISNLDDAIEAITQIILQGEGAQISNKKNISDAESHYEKFKYIKKELDSETGSKYELWNVRTDPMIEHFDEDFTPNLGLVAKAFNAAYCYLLLLLDFAWSIEDDVQKRNLIIGGMPSLMSGVVGNLAEFLVRMPISSEDHAGPTFSFFEFTTRPQDNPKSQLIEVIQAAVRAFPSAPRLKTALTAAESVPELSYKQRV